MNLIKQALLAIYDKTKLLIVATLFNGPIFFGIYFKFYRPFSVVMSAVILLFLAALYIFECNYE